MKRKIINIVSGLIVALSLWFIFKKLYNLDFMILLSKYNHVWIIQAAVYILMYMASLFILALNWTNILTFLNIKNVHSEMHIFIYLRTIIAKYIPGNVMQFISRHYLHRRLGINNSNLIVGSLIEITYMVFISIIFVIYGVFFKGLQISDKFVLNNINLNRILIPSSIVIVGGVCFLIFRKKHYTNSFQFIWNKKKIYLIPLMMLMYTLFFILTGLILYLTLTITLKLQGINIMFILCAFSLSWVLGFVVVGAPGGIGIRESILILMLGSRYGITEVTISSILLRLITIMGEVLAYFLAAIVEKCTHIENKNDE